uniref:Uncharacterized protein n=1 Tax=uncultured bacterium contig00178 TaxID=1181600 RepID=A0A806K2H6_9BACT|nr:hypothetical protein [uncultured bacterium contig00178]
MNGVYVGLTGEANENSLSNFAGGGAVSFGLDINSFIEAGLKGGFSYGIDDKLNSIEAMGLLRFKLPVLGLFAQAEAGGVMFLYEEYTFFSALGGIVLGSRIFLTERFYIEPCARAGYPFIWGGGLTMGLYFDLY